jgi:hypothetical protein
MILSKAPGIFNLNRADADAGELRRLLKVLGQVEDTAAYPTSQVQYL